AEKEGEQVAASLAPPAAAKPEAAKSAADRGVLKALRAIPAEQLLKSAETETVRPIVDSWVLPQDVASTFAQGKQNDVPLIVGYNADEGTTLAPQAANLKAAMFAA